MRNHLSELNLNINLTDDELLTIAKALKKAKITSITSLNLSRDDFDVEVSDKSIKKILGLCPNLKSLDLSGRVELTYQTFSVIGNRSKNIETLILSACYNLNNHSFNPIASKCLKLKKVDAKYIDKFNNNCLETLGKYSPNLEYLDIEGCRFISNRGLKHLRNNKKINTLYISRMKQISKRGLHPLIKSLRLERFALTDCQLIESNSIKFLLNNQNLSTITLELDLDDKTQKMIIDHKNLKSIHLIGAIIKSEALNQLLIKPQFECLTLERCQYPTDLQLINSNDIEMKHDTDLNTITFSPRKKSTQNF